MTGCWGPTSSINTIDATLTHQTSCWELSQEGNRQQPEGRNLKTTGPQKFSHPRNPLTSRNQMHAMTSALGAVIHYMQRDFNAQLGNSNVRCATNLVTSLLCVIRKVKANSYPLLFSQENPKHNKFKWGPYTPTMMLIRVNLTLKLKIPSAYR